MELREQGKGSLGKGRLTEGWLRDLMWPEPWAGDGRGPLGPGGSSMACAVRELHLTQHASAAGTARVMGHTAPL